MYCDLDFKALPHSGLFLYINIEKIQKHSALISSLLLLINYKQKCKTANCCMTHLLLHEVAADSQPGDQTSPEIEAAKDPCCDHSHGQCYHIEVHH